MAEDDNKSIEEHFENGIKKACEVLSDLIQCDDCPLNCERPTPGECINALCLYVAENMKVDE